MRTAGSRCPPTRPWGQAGAGSRPSLSHYLPASNPQILPQEEDYGFDIEEKKQGCGGEVGPEGPLAEVRRLRGASPAPWPCRQESGAPSSSSESPGMAVVPPGSLSSWGD